MGLLNEFRQYFPAHCISWYSLGRGCLSPETWCRFASSNAYPGIGMVDDGNFYGLIEFLQSALQYGLRPLAGVRFQLEDGNEITAYCLNKKGFARLCRIISAIAAVKEKKTANSGLSSNSSRSLNKSRFSDREGTEEGFSIEKNLLENGWPGIWLAVSSPALAKKFIGSLTAGNTEDSRVFLRLTYGIPFADMVKTARRYNIPLLAVNDALYITQQQRRVALLVRSIACLESIVQCGKQHFPGIELRARTAEEMNAYFSTVPEALLNATRLFVVSQIEELLRPGFVFPAFRGLNEGQAFSRLRSLCIKGVSKRYGSMTEAVRQRLFTELRIIRNKGFSAYFLVVHDIVTRHGRTCGRGSSASSIVSYLLEITHVDPLAYNLFFERFLNEARIDPPDIDVDFPWDERPKALAYVFDTYPGRAGMVADHVTFKDKAALRETAKAFGKEENQIKAYQKAMRFGNVDIVPECIRNYAAALRGMPRYIATHPGGVVITPGPITNYTHIQPTPAGIPVIAWEKDATEQAGLVKIDLLGNRSLSVLRDAEGFIQKQGQEKTWWSKASPEKDAVVRNMLRNGDTLGLFYVESPATRQLLKKMHCGDYAHLVIASSIIRPAANRWIQQYLERLHGAPFQYVHPRIAETLSETCGIMVYQEDVSRVAMAAAGFNAAEADQLRKILSKKDRLHNISRWKERFFSGAFEKGLTKEAVVTLWNMIESFKGYSFCKAHSASYALLSCKLSFLKAYYPLSFFAAVINNGGGFYSRQVYINEVRRLGFKILLPDVNKSNYLYTIDGNALRVGFCQVAALRRETIDRLLAERQEKGRFRSWEDFIRRVYPSGEDLRMLIKAGALDCIAAGYSRPQMFWKAYHGCSLKDELFDSLAPPAWLGEYSEEKRQRDEFEVTGLYITAHPLTVLQTYGACKNYKPVTENAIPAETAGCTAAGKKAAVDTVTEGSTSVKKGAVHNSVTTVAPHKKESYYNAFSKGHPQSTDSRSISKCIGTRVCIQGFLIAGKEVLAKGRQPMCFLSFSDEYGVFETVVFPDIYAEVAKTLEQSKVFSITGMVTAEYGAVIIEIERLIPFSFDSMPFP